MALNLEAKKTIVANVNEVAKSSIAVGVAHYNGLSVTDMTALRKSAIAENVSLRVVKNTLAKRAFSDTDFECMMPVLSGPVLLGFSQEDPGAVARVFHKFTKENSKLVVNGLGIAGEFVDGSQLARIADLPTKDQAISMIMALMLAPVEKLARTLAEVPTKITRVLAAVGEIKN